MNLDILTFCDYARQYSNKLTIVGAFTKLMCDKLPLVDYRFTVVARLLFEKSDIGKHRLELTLKNDSDEEILSIESSLNIQEFSEPTKSLNVILDGSSIQFNEEGKYTFTIKCDEQSFSTSINVICVNKITNHA